jgi:hypothetical protein
MNSTINKNTTYCPYCQQDVAKSYAKRHYKTKKHLANKEKSNKANIAFLAKVKVPKGNDYPMTGEAVNSDAFLEMIADFAPNGRKRETLCVQTLANELASKLLNTRRFNGEDITEDDAFEMIAMMEDQWEIDIQYKIEIPEEMLDKDFIRH